MHEIEPSGKLLCCDVVPENLEAWVARRLAFEKVGLEIGGEHGSTWRDLLGQPERDGATTGADLEAAAALGHTQAEEMLTGAGIERRLETRQAGALLDPCVVIRVRLA